MSFSRPQPAPRVPTPPKGDEVAAYDTYLEAQQAVDFLADNKFPVEHVTIVGTDLKMVERVTGRLTYGRVALAGAMSGAWFGLFVGLLLSLFSQGASAVIFVGIALGAGFGLLFSVLSYAFTGGRRDFTSSSQIVASAYAILCATEAAGDARALLVRSPSGLGRARSGVRVGAPAAAGATVAGAQAPGTPAAPAPRAPDPRWTTPTGEPRYGAMLPTTQPGQPGQGPQQGQQQGPQQGQQQGQPATPAQPVPPAPPAAGPEGQQPGQQPQAPVDPYAVPPQQPASPRPPVDDDPRPRD
ncbi:general stress protein [Puerhibacterium sp. TATVAM-FAB25]|uniref:general stress protein n=1 Tax=Puerhibacterium sp. TATVAM-FAB25 TaxID=3093699 RepID=UPI00397BC7C3